MRLGKQSIDRVSGTREDNSRVSFRGVAAIAQLRWELPKQAQAADQVQGGEKGTVTGQGGEELGGEPNKGRIEAPLTAPHGDCVG
jgi:hypothetical protein